jgi:hypothetical protein
MRSRHHTGHRATIELAAIALLCGTACRYDPGSPPPVPPPILAADGEERLVWEQPLLERSTIERYRFVAYLDGARMDLADATCAGLPTASGVRCEASVPPLTSGRHVLTVAAILTDTAGAATEGPPSQVLVVTHR